MNEIEFRKWLLDNGVNKKVASDNISRLRKIEKEIKNCDIDEQYRSDKCEYLLSLFLKKGENDEMKRYPNAKLPIGKYSLGTYRLAIKKYIDFMNSLNS